MIKGVIYVVASVLLWFFCATVLVALGMSLTVGIVAGGVAAAGLMYEVINLVRK